MSIKTKIIIVTLIFAVPAFFLGKIIWPLDPNGPIPTSSQLPLLIILNLFESVSFGLGASFIIFGYPLVKKAVGSHKNLTLWSYIAISWLLINWWPHDNWHASNGMNLSGLIIIEYTFHVTLIISGIILALAFIRVFGKSKSH